VYFGKSILRFDRKALLWSFLFLFSFFFLISLTSLQTFYTRFLEREMRPDGRTLDEIRSTEISVNNLENTCFGSSFIQQGRTVVVGGVQGELVRLCGTQWSDGGANVYFFFKREKCWEKS
jgi:hypothetical protein